MKDGLDILEQLGGVRPALIQEALEEAPKKRSLSGFAAPLAACAACAVLMGGVAFWRCIPNISIQSAPVAESSSHQMTIVSENGNSAIIQPVYDRTGVLFIDEDSYEISGHITDKSEVVISDSSDLETNSETEDEWEADEETLYYAYMDYDSATDEDKEKILAAREEIIWHTSWVAEGYYGYTYDVETGEIIDVTPQFYDIFPEDWEIPTLEEDLSNCWEYVDGEWIAPGGDNEE